MLVALPCSRSLSYWWNLGSFLAMALVMQVISGVLLLLNYNSLLPFDAINFIMVEVNFGWLMKIFHSNNASMVFLLLYLHLYKNMGMGSFRLVGVWNSGVTMMLLIMGAGFSGYVLVGSQMSYWATVVITGLISVVPYGEKLMYFIWGGYMITWNTTELMMVIHFILPFMVLGLMVVHLNLLHRSGSTSPLYSHSGVGKISFYPFYWWKDLMNILVYLLVVGTMMVYPYALGEVELFEDVNTLNSPLHIVPEWYFLSQYAVLRSVPHKGLGVVLMLMSVMVLYMYPLFAPKSVPLPSIFLKVFSWAELLIFSGGLGYMGSMPISPPYTTASLVLTVLYFITHFVMLLVMYVWNLGSSVKEKKMKKKTEGPL